MKLIYWMSLILPAPFYAASWVFYGTSWVLSFIGDMINEYTCYRVWLVMHKRACTKLFAEHS